jgi:hypothetical protein
MTGRPHVRPVPSVEQGRRGLARLIDHGEASDAEITYYEWESDPDARALNQDRRRRAGQYLRRVRRRERRGKE